MSAGWAQDVSRLSTLPKNNLMYHSRQEGGFFPGEVGEARKNGRFFSCATIEDVQNSLLGLQQEIERGAAGGAKRQRVG